MDIEECLSEWAIVRQALAVRKMDPKLKSCDKDVAETLLYIIQHLNHLTHISYIANALSVLIVSTADCERGFSLLKLVKTPLRNALGTVALNHAMHVSINGDMPFNQIYGKAKNLFTSKKRRVI